jgi:hypothetical protein
MASQLGSLFTPGYDSTMQGLIGDENADQARGQQAMSQMQNQQLAQQELQQRANSDMQDYQLASRGMDIQQDEGEKNRLQDLMRDDKGFERSLKLQEIAAGDASKLNVQKNDFELAQIKLASEYEAAKYRKQQKSQLEIALIQQKAEEARLNGDFESAKLIEEEATQLRNKATKEAMALGVASALGNKSQTEIEKSLSLIGQRLAEVQRNYESSSSLVQGAWAQNTGRMLAKRKEQAVQKVKEMNAQRDAYLYQTPALRAVSPNLEGLENIEGIEFLKFNPAENVGGSIYALNPFRATSDYGFGEEMNADEMQTYISDEIATTTLDLIDQMGIKGIDRTAGAEAIKAAMQGRPEAEVIALVQQAKIDPVIFKGVFDQFAKDNASMLPGGELRRAQSLVTVASESFPGQNSVQLRAAKANLKAVKTREAMYRKAARALTNVTDLPAIKSMIEAINAANKDKNYAGLVDTRMAEASRLVPDSPDVFKDLAAARASQLKSLQDTAQLGTSGVETQRQLGELESRRKQSKLKGDMSAAAVARSELERLLRESDE